MKAVGEVGEQQAGRTDRWGFSFINSWKRTPVVLIRRTLLLSPSRSPSHRFLTLESSIVALVVLIIDIITLTGNSDCPVRVNLVFGTGRFRFLNK